MNTKWSRRGNTFYMSDQSSTINKLSPHVYQLNMDSDGHLYLEKIYDQFELPEKLYGLEDNFIARVVRKFKSMKRGNLGVLLNGIRGAGKTVSAKQICIDANLPVILITAPYSGIPAFIQEVNQDIVVFIDEFEKIYHKQEDAEMGPLLTLMDGVYNTEFVRLYVLTSNTHNINENFKDRPGRIRYLKQFNGLSESVVREIVDDLLIYPDHKEDLLDQLGKSRLLTIDIVFALTDDVNVHNEKASVLFPDFNCEEKISAWDVHRKLIKDDDTLGEYEHVGRANVVYPELASIRVGYEGYTLRLNGDNIGVIKKVISSSKLVIEVEGITSKGKKATNDKQYLYVLEPVADTFGAITSWRIDF